ncbi:MAG: NFACT family protein, partial [Clostridia bacterium]
MPLDAIALRAQVNELEEIIGFKIDKIQQPEKDMIVLLLRGAGTSRRLRLCANSANPRVHLTEGKYENPAVPPMFCMLLRKHLSGGKITAVRQLGFERIIDVEIESYTELGDLTPKHLLCEIMGRNSNLIFLNEEMKIIDSIKHVDITVSSVRNILPGLKYILPPDSGRLDPMEAASADFLAALENAEEGTPADKAITSAVGGISPLIARECVFAACGDGNLKIGEMTDNMKQKTAVALEKMFVKIRESSFEPCVVLKEDGSVSDFAPFVIRQYGERVRIEKKESMNAAIEEYYFLRDRDARMKNHSAAITKTINNNLSRAVKKLNLLQSDLKASLD